MLPRIRNAAQIRAKDVTCLKSKVCVGIAQVLRDEGYINSFELADDGRSGKIKIKLKYGPRGETILHAVKRESKPGRRVYKGVEEIPRPIQGLGICIVSTSKGVMSDRKCRDQRLGGELLAQVH